MSDMFQKNSSPLLKRKHFLHVNSVNDTLSKQKQYVQEQEELVASESNQKWKAIYIFGPPGVGKGTVGKKIAEVTHHFHLSSGNIFREISPHSPMGKKYSNYMQRGSLIPDECTVGTWYFYVQGLIYTNRFHPNRQILLLDGIPRTLAQESKISAYLDVLRILVLEIKDEDVLIERIQKRGFEEGRKDDTHLDTLKNRLNIYHQQTKEILDRYPEEMIVRVDASQTKLRVFHNSLDLLMDTLDV